MTNSAAGYSQLRDGFLAAQAEIVRLEELLEEMITAPDYTGPQAEKLAQATALMRLAVKALEAENPGDISGLDIALAAKGLRRANEDEDGWYYCTGPEQLIWVIDAAQTQKD